MRRLLAGFALAAVAGAASANPTGAPWGAADPNAAMNCSSCHFDGAPQNPSDAIRIVGLPDKAAPGVVYDLAVAFDKSAAPVAGFMLTASAGDFLAPDGETVEARAREVRSIAVVAGDSASGWRAAWRAPAEIPPEISFYLAVNFGNDDASPLGDEIHYRKVTIARAR